ncbi:MAG: UDP-2,3-diacylglucosamine diphosphatase [Bacteroidetes bacterium]|nr:UDP-2,3-diacylglucosamine diphosphatase [Bacteroidota bacterium]
MIYFLSDFHLGAPDYARSLVREKKVVAFLDSIKKDASEIYLMGDVFDFWFEYGKAVPKGYVRLLGKLAELSDAGIKLHYFTGNHDMWVFDYLPQELNLKIYRNPITREINGKKFYLAHGDGLGPGDFGYKFIKAVFASKVCQWLFARIHPNLGIGIAQFWSGKSRKLTEELHFHGEKEWLVIHSREILKKEYFDYFIFGHRHLPIDMNLTSHGAFPPSGQPKVASVAQGKGASRYINLGEWISHFSYAVFDGKELSLKYFRE